VLGGILFGSSALLGACLFSAGLLVLRRPAFSLFILLPVVFLACCDIKDGAAARTVEESYPERSSRSHVFYIMYNLVWKSSLLNYYTVAFVSLFILSCGSTACRFFCPLTFGAQKQQHKQEEE
jgi:hypothetical protein